MQIAEVLSDLTSLRVCGPEEALALVKGPQNPTSSSDISSPSDQKNKPRKQSKSTADSGLEDSDENDPDLTRVRDVMELQKIAQKWQPDGKDKELEKARQEVNALMQDLRRKR
ncbi:MAG: hypothetical protein M4579_002832 [Chaenotheca gracillima]|nr:MAG: hypothetical protein M4579_002832 [Chaenotheca gracillima]